MQHHAQPAVAPSPSSPRLCAPRRLAARIADIAGWRPAARTVLTAAADSAAAEASTSGRVIVLYGKPNCPLCDGTRERVQGLIDRAAFMPSKITGYMLQVRDITTDPVWAAKFDMEVPVLFALAADGSEVPIPRAPPRTTTDRLLKHIEAALPQ